MTEGDVLEHKLFVKLGAQEIIDEFALFGFIILARCLVLENKIIVPAPSDRKARARIGAGSGGR